MPVHALTPYDIEMSEFIKNLPKAELHRHLELCVRPETIKELAPEVGISVSTEEDFKRHFLIEEPMNDLGSVLQKFLDTQKLLFNPEILERVAFEACEDAYLKENLRVVEFRYAPTFVAQNHDMTFSEIHKAIVKGVERAEKMYPMAVGLLCIIQRILPVAEAEAVTNFAIENRDSFLGLDLADNEVGFDSKPFASFFKAAKDAGLKITVHSGEANVPKAPEYVRDAIDYLGADRIGHGVQVYKSPEMIQYLIDKDVALELCPTSNWLTNAIPNRDEHPFRQLLSKGVPLSLNTDDPGIFGIDLNGECEFVMKRLGVTEEELKKVFQMAVDYSFIPKEKIAKVWPAESSRG